MVQLTTHFRALSQAVRLRCKEVSDEDQNIDLQLQRP